MITLYFSGWAFRFCSTLIDEAKRINWRDGYQSACRYYYVEENDA